MSHPVPLLFKDCIRPQKFGTYEIFRIQNVAHYCNTTVSTHSLEQKCGKQNKYTIELEATYRFGYLFPGFLKPIHATVGEGCTYL